MTITYDDPAPAGHRRLHRLSRRTSVIYLLVLLVAIPSVALPVFSWSFVQDRLERAEAAAQVADSLRTISKLDRLRMATLAETSSNLINGSIKTLHLPASILSLIPSDAISDNRSSVAATDAALASIRDGKRISGLTPAADRMAADLATARQTLTQAEGSASPTGFQLLLSRSQDRYAGVVGDIELLERTLFFKINSGATGISTPALLRATAAAQAVSAVVSKGGLAVNQYFGLQLIQDPSATQVQALIRSAASFDSLAADLSPMLSDQLATSWTAFLADPQVRSLRQAIKTSIGRAAQGRDLRLAPTTESFLGLMADVGAAALTFSKLLSGVLAQAVTEGLDSAQAGRAAAEARARTGLALSAVALLITLLMLVAIGGLIRWRLVELASSAKRLSAGTLNLTPVHGPYEIAIATEGLNDAVTNLREITYKATVITSGDISSPLLEQPLPGPLGAAMHTSFAKIVTMIRERDALQQELSHRASHDNLTGLVNRGAAEHLLADAVEAAKHGDSGVGLLFVDLDHFKLVNDTHGHGAGDHVLKAVAERLKGVLGEAGVGCRLGGDELLAVIPGARGPDELIRTGARLVQAIAEPTFYRDQVLTVGASVGISLWPREGAPGTGSDASDIAEWLLNQADDAVYRAKAAGRNLATF